jgi:hypothetical protein
MQFVIGKGNDGEAAYQLFKLLGVSEVGIHECAIFQGAISSRNHPPISREILQQEHRIESQRRVKKYFGIVEADLLLMSRIKHISDHLFSPQFTLPHRHT